MKKILIALMMLLAFTKTEAQIGFVSQTTQNIDSAWVVFESNTPGSTMGNRINWIHINRHRIKVRAKKVFLDTLATKDASSVYKFVHIAPDGELKAISTSSVLFNISNITSLQTTLNGKLTQATADGLYKPLTYLPDWADIQNKPMTITEEADPIFTVSPAYAITSTEVSNWNTSYGWGNHATVGYLTSEVDGSTSNELQTISKTGTVITLSNGGGTVGVTDATAPTSITATNGSTVTQSGQSFTIDTKQIYTNTVAIAGGAGNAVFYLTSDKTSGGTALYANDPNVIPIVNDAANNYTYGWTLSGDKKTLTVNVKVSQSTYIALLGINLLGIPANAANGVVVQVTTIQR